MDAEFWLSQERRLIDINLWTPPAARAAEQAAHTITLADYAHTWVQQRNVKPSTKIEYRRLLAGPLANLANLELRHLTGQAVRAWYAALPDTPTRNAHAYGLLHAIAKTAVTDEHLSANPCAIVGASNVTRKRDPVILTPGELAAVADTITPDRLRCFVLVAAWCGLRFGEMIELRRSDISDTCEVIVVSRAVTHRDGCRIDTTKSGKGRAVVVPPHIRADLKHHLDVHVSPSPDALVFPALRDGCHLNDSVFAKHFAPACAAIGRAGVRIHDLRHFAGTQTARVGNLVETMGRLGHSTVKASLIYQGVVSGRDAEIAQALSALAAGADTA
jgi:integrase